ncbi:hypothetical protein EV356DRAFT_519099 [Viridothelium virens]|uniref:Fungal N-terminal domain-containing protein n=1 Tax=Viridothelium virens TaxID=1048519 RepID=A0A6A6H056_VIRVR|nr:hypothetical protein EV356DRAFT_519099 [Viridothelium virens]
MEALGLAASCIQIVELAATSIKHIHSLQRKLQNVDQNTQMVLSQLTAVKSAVNRIQIWLDQQSPETFWIDDLSSDLDLSLDACRRLVGLISEQLGELNAAQTTFSWKERFRQVWNEEEVKGYRDMLRDHIQALSLLLQVAKLPSTERKSTLQNAETRGVIERAWDASSSLMWLWDTNSFTTERSTISDDLSRLSVSFAFDVDVLGSRAYQAMFASKIPPDLSRNGAEIQTPTTDAFHLGQQAAGLRFKLISSKEKPSDSIVPLISAHKSASIDAHTAAGAIALSSNQWSITDGHQPAAPTEESGSGSANAASVLINIIIHGRRENRTSFDKAALVFGTTPDTLIKLMPKAYPYGFYRSRPESWNPGTLSRSAIQAIAQLTRSSQIIPVCEYYRQQLIRRSLPPLTGWEYELLRSAWSKMRRPLLSDHIPIEELPKFLSKTRRIHKLTTYTEDFRLHIILRTLVKRSDIRYTALNHRLERLPVTEIKQRRSRLEFFYEECLLLAHPLHGLSFSTLIFMLGTYEFVRDGSEQLRDSYRYISKAIANESGFQLAYRLRRHARLEEIAETIARKRLKGLFETAYWSRRFHKHLYTKRRREFSENDSTNLLRRSSSPSALIPMAPHSTLLEIPRSPRSANSFSSSPSSPVTETSTQKDSERARRMAESIWTEGVGQTADSIPWI